MNNIHRHEPINKATFLVELFDIQFRILYVIPQFFPASVFREIHIADFPHPHSTLYRNPIHTDSKSLQ